MGVTTREGVEVWVHVGRQAIVDAAGTPAAYELLFRSAADAASAQVENGDQSTAQVLVTTFLEFGLHDVVGALPAFVNVPRAFLVGELPLPFPPGQVVLEVLEDVPADEDVVAGVERLVEQGYRFALDDVTARDCREELLPLAQYVKIDLLATDPAELPELVAACRGNGRRLIGEKVETPEQLARCQELGITLFQGYLFSRPRTLTRRGLSPSSMACLHLVALLATAEVSTKEVVRTVTDDPAMTLKVLQAVSSAAVGHVRRVSSVHEAVVLVGRESLQAWAALMALGGVLSPVPLAAALARARMTQLLAVEVAADPSACFLVGLLSGLAAPLDLTLSALMDTLQVTEDVSQALLHESGPLSPVLAGALAYERGEAPALPGPGGGQARRAYLDGLCWSERTLSASHSA